MKSFILMLTFLTRIPVPVRGQFNKEDFGRGLMYMPVIGIVIGIPLYLFVENVALESSFLKAFLLLLIYLAVTGGLHLDGLADYFDGTFSGRTRENILKIMKDSTIGAFGVIGLCLYFIGMMIGLGSVDALGVFLMPILGRCIGLGMCAFGAYPREAGMGQSMVDYGRWYHGVATLVVFFGAAWLAGFAFFMAAISSVILLTVFYLRTVRIIGGITGDVIGASIELSQVIWLISLMIFRGI